MLGPEQQVRHENAAFRSLLGFGAEEKGGVEGWLAAACPEADHREKVINSWREHIWRNQITRTFTLKNAEQKPREIEFRSSLLPDGGISLTTEDVTERRRSEVASRLGKLKFKALFSHTETGTVLVDRTDRIIDANPAFVHLSGLSLKELRLATLKSLFHPRDAETLARLERKDPEDEVGSDSAGTSGSVEFHLRTPSGEKPVRLVYCPVSEGTGRAAMGIYLLSEPGSKSGGNPLEARLRTVAAKAKALLNAVPDLILLVDADGRITDFAAPPVAWEGLTPDDTWRNRPAEEVWPVFGHLLRQCTEKVRRGLRTLHADLRSPSEGGFEFSVTLAPCEGGEILAVVRNHSELRSLREREFWERIAFDSSPVPTLRIDRGGIVAEANRAASESLDPAQAGLAGTRFSDLLDSKSGHATVCSMDGRGTGLTAQFLAIEEEGRSRGSLVYLHDKVGGPRNEEGAHVRGDLHRAEAGELRQHAFRNQLQLVTSLFSLEPQGTEARDAFLRWQIRLRALALSCPNDPGGRVWIHPLLRELADEVCSLLGRGPGRREMILTGDESLAFDPQTAAPFALLIGEVLRLALVHRRPAPGPALNLHLRPESGPDGGFRLTVRPGNGCDFSLAGRDSEIETLELLTEQIRGRLEVTDPANPSKEWILVVPANEG